MKSCPAVLLSVLAVASVPMAAAASEWLHQSREPLIDRRGNVAFEGRRILLASDTYPRQAARFVQGPSARRDVLLRLGEMSGLAK